MKRKEKVRSNQNSITMKTNILKKFLKVLVQISGVFVLCWFGFIMILKIIAFFGGSNGEVSRIRSPDHKWDAVVVMENPGAFSSFRYELYLVPAGDKPERGEKILCAYSMGEYKIEWKKSNFLIFSYRKAFITFFRNYWYTNKSWDDLYDTIKIAKDKKPTKTMVETVTRKKVLDDLIEIRLSPINPSFSFE